MKDSFFCSVAAQRAREDLIGTAGHYQTYVLIECPTPWPAIALDSSGIPPTLRQYIEAISAEKSVRFLCIERGISGPPGHTTLLIYEQSSCSESGANPSQFTNGYQGYEFHLPNLAAAIPCLEAYWQNATAHSRPALSQKIEQQDILICTHGMRDKCCAKLGKPIFRGAKRMVEKGKLPNARVWKASHIGGHRFAPTAITFPDGRYYGRLSLSALQAIVTRQGPIEQLRPVYRGWGMLPRPLQLLEKDLLLTYGWSWLNRALSYQQLCSDVNKGEIVAKLFVQQASGSVIRYRAKLIQDEQQTYYGKASCGDALPSKIVKYAVAECFVEQDRIEQDRVEQDRRQPQKSA